MKKDQDIETTDKHLNISITKIFNWPQTQSQTSFDLVFHSQLENSPIIKKTVTGNHSANSMNLNAYLKITYTREESKVIMKLYEQSKQEQLGAFQIDLEQLATKNVLYYPFGKDHVLQVNKYEPKSTEMHVHGDRMSNTFQNSYHKANPYRLERNSSNKMLATSPTYFERESRQNMSRYDFQEKVLGLLKEVREMKNQAGLATRLAGLNSHKDKNQKPQTITKSYSQRNLANAREIGRQKKGQRHRLILDTLDIVPYDILNDKDSNRRIVNQQKVY